MSTPHWFVHEHGDPGRRSRTSATPRQYTTVERLVFPPEEVERWPVKPSEPARYIVVDPSGQQIAIVFNGTVVIVQPYGARLLIAPELANWAVLGTPKGLLYGPHLHPWSGADKTRIPSRALLMDDEPRTQAALAQTDERWISVVSSTPDWDAPEVRIESRQPDGDGYRTQWRGHLPGECVAAVDDAHKLAVLTREGLHVYGPTPPEKRASPLFKHSTPASAYAVSAGVPGWLVLSARDLEPHYPAEHPQRSSLRPAQRLQQRWHTVVHAWDSDGKAAWELTVPFEVYQPPIERSDGTLVVVGRGLAGIDNGKVAWELPTDNPAAATAFSDGSVAVVDGGALRILDAKNTFTQTLTVPHGEDIVTQPTIAPDGTIYVATPTRVYSVR